MYLFASYSLDVAIATSGTASPREAVDLFKDLSASLTPLGLSELYTAL